MLPEEISLTSTPKRSSIPQAVSTPAPVSMSESVETAEAKAALKQVFFLFQKTLHKAITVWLVGFFTFVSTLMSILWCSCRKFLRTIKKKKQRMTSCWMNKMKSFRSKSQNWDHKMQRYPHSWSLPPNGKLAV